MPKASPIPCTREEMDAILKTSMDDDFSLCYSKLQGKLEEG